MQSPPNPQPQGLSTPPHSEEHPTEQNQIVSQEDTNRRSRKNLVIILVILFLLLFSFICSCMLVFVYLTSQNTISAPLYSTCLNAPNSLGCENCIAEGRKYPANVCNSCEDLYGQKSSGKALNQEDTDFFDSNCSEQVEIDVTRFPPSTDTNSTTGYEITYLENNKLNFYDSRTKSVENTVEIPSFCIDNPNKSYIDNPSKTHYAYDCTNDIQVYDKNGLVYKIDKNFLKQNPSSYFDAYLSKSGNILAIIPEDYSEVIIYDNRIQDFRNKVFTIEEQKLFTLNVYGEQPTPVGIESIGHEDKYIYLTHGYGDDFTLFANFVLDIDTQEIRTIDTSYFGNWEAFFTNDGYIYAPSSGTPIINKYSYETRSLIESINIGTTVYAESRQTGDYGFSLRTSKDGRYLYIYSSDPACDYALVEDTGQDTWQELCPNPDERNKFVVYDVQIKKIITTIPQSQLQDYYFLPGRDSSHLLQKVISQDGNRSFTGAIREYDIQTGNFTEIFNPEGEILKIEVI